MFNGCVTVNEFWSAFYNTVYELVERFVPVRQRRQWTGSSTKYHCLPKSIRKLRLLKRRAWRLWKAKPCVISKTDFNLALRQYRSAVRYFLATQEDQFLAAGPRKFFAYAARQLHPIYNSLLFRSSSGLTSEPMEICAILSNEFVKNFDSPQLVPSTLCYSGHVFAPPNADNSHVSSTSSPSLSCVNVSVMDVRLALAQLVDSAAGPDGIPAKFYKKLAHYLAEPLACVYQQLLRQARVPDIWKQAKVIAIYKGKGDKNDVSSTNLSALLQLRVRC